MCWSQEVSFFSGAVLLGGGFATVRAAMKYDRPAIALSLVTVIFGIHQLTEGLVWHFLPTGQHLYVLSHLYIYIAVLLWPVLIPVVSLLTERDAQRKLLLVVPMLTGIVTTVYSGWLLAIAKGIDVIEVGHSLSYQIGHINPPGLWLHLLYAFSVVAPLVLNTRKMMKVFGLSVFGTFAFSFVMLRDVYFSVWCIMCAWLSLIIYFTIERPRTDGHA